MIGVFFLNCANDESQDHFGSRPSTLHVPFLQIWLNPIYSRSHFHEFVAWIADLSEAHQLGAMY